MISMTTGTEQVVQTPSMGGRPANTISLIIEIDQGSEDNSMGSAPISESRRRRHASQSIGPEHLTHSR